MSEEPKPRWFRSAVWSNALVMLLVGQTMSLALLAIHWAIDRPHPKDVIPDLLSYIAFGSAIGGAASLGYLAYSGAKRCRREWFRFRLRTLFVLLTMAGIVLGWVVANLNWIRERHEFEVEQTATLAEAVRSPNWGKNHSNRFVPRYGPSWATSATLWILGESASDHPSFFFWGELRPDDLARVQRLYPEATRILCVIMPEENRPSR